MAVKKHNLKNNKKKPKRKRLKKRFSSLNGNKLDNSKNKIAKYLEMGLDLNESCLLAGVSKQKLGELRSDPDFNEFVEKCQAQNEFDHIQNIKNHSRLSWQASSWVLERKYPDKYGKKDTVKHEYEIKLMTFQKIILGVINEVCTPLVRKEILRKLREIDLDTINDQKALPVPNSTIDLNVSEESVYE